MGDPEAVLLNNTNVGGDFEFYTVHCCTCNPNFCDHTGGPYYCNLHNPNYTPSTWITTWPNYDADLHGKLDKIIELLERLVK